MKILKKINKTKAKPNYLKVCNGCGHAFSSNRSTAIWCGDNCKKRNYRMNIRLIKRKEDIERIKSKYNL